MNLSDGFPKKIFQIHFTICLSCRILLGNLNYANYAFYLKISFYLKNFVPPPPQESFVSENLEGVPPKKFLAALPPPPEKILEESQNLYRISNAILILFWIFSGIAHF